MTNTPIVSLRAPARRRRVAAGLAVFGLVAAGLVAPQITRDHTPEASAATYGVPRNLLVLGNTLAAQSAAELTAQWVTATGGTTTTARTTATTTTSSTVSWTTASGAASIQFRVRSGELCDNFATFGEWLANNPQRILVQVDGFASSSCMLDGMGTRLTPGTADFDIRLKADIRSVMDFARAINVPVVFSANPPMQDPAREAQASKVTAAVQAEGVHVQGVTLDLKTRTVVSSTATSAAGTYTATMACAAVDTAAKGCITNPDGTKTIAVRNVDGANFCPSLSNTTTCSPMLYGGYSSGTYRFAKQMVTTAKATTLTELYKADPRSAAGLAATFSKDVAGIAGMDYQRAIDLGNGSTLWTFQDVRLTSGSFIHNAALLGKPGTIAGSITYTLKKSGTAAPWLGGATCPTTGSLLGLACTKPFTHWFWPMAGTLDSAGNIRIFVAEMVNDSGAYLSATHPVATWLATVNPTTLTVTSFTKAPDPSADLFGFNITADPDYTYLTANCYVQFMGSIYYLGMAPCSGKDYVARLPKGQLGASPEYLTANGWSATKTNLADVSPVDPSRNGSDPMQIMYQPATATRAARWVAVTKGNDWWGTTIAIDVAAAEYLGVRLAPGQGGWTTVQTIEHTPYLAGPSDITNTYFASFGPTLDPDNGNLVVGLGRNRWDGVMDTNVYQPTFFNVALPL